MRVAVVGLGLMGASLGLALRRARPPVFVAGYARREATRQLALARGVVDESCADLAGVVRDADVAVFCTPVLSIVEQVRPCLPHFPEDCLVTDVASTKGELCRDLDALFVESRAVFCGSHPIAGSDANGLEAARADLYEESCVVVTPTAATRPSAVKRVTEFWGGLRAHVAVMQPEEHDRMLARTSHLPHIVASALVSHVLSGDPRREDFCGSGFRDATRIAGGPADIWIDILRSNAASLAQEARQFRGELERFEGLLQAGDFAGLRAWLEKSSALRRRLSR